MNIIEYEKRLKAYSLTEGFNIVKNGGGTKKTPSITFSYIHHGDATTNRRKLKERVIRNSKNEVVLKRKRESTSVR